MHLQRLAALLLVLLGLSAQAQNNAPHPYLFNQAVSPLSSSVAEAGLLSSHNQDPFIAPVSMPADSNALQLLAGIAVPSGGNNRLNLSAGKAFQGKLYLSVGYGAQNLGYKEGVTAKEGPNGIKSRALAFNILYRIEDFTLQLGGSRFTFNQDENIKEVGFYNSIGAAYTWKGLSAGLQLRGLPIGQSVQTIQTIEMVNGEEVSKKEDNAIKLPTQILVPLSYLYTDSSRFTAFVEVNGGLTDNRQSGTSQLLFGGMARIGYKPFFIQGGIAQSGFSDGNFKAKIGVGAGVELKNFSILYSYSTNQVFKSLTMHSLGVAISLGSK